MKRLTINDVSAYLRDTTEPTALLDVRTPEEFRQGHLPGAVNLPLSSLSKASSLYDKNDHLILYCHSGARSRLGAFQLKLRGFKKVTNAGGIQDYRGEQAKD